jgi:DNA-binding beta-propeller fold protein YncE
MGSTNFVISTFQNLISRNPILSEQQSGVSMVDGNNAVLFLQSGSSKNEYLNILTQSSSYYEGQVIQFYKKYLNRIPNSVEMADGTQKYITTDDFTAVQRDILATDEFIDL